AGWDRRRRGWPRARWCAPAPRSTPGNGGRSQPTASAVILFIVVCACSEGRAYPSRMPSHIQVHALADIAGEPERLTYPAPLAHRLGTAGEHTGRAAAQRHGATVAHDAAGRPDGQPEASADHRAYLPPVRSTAGSLPAFRIWPGSSAGFRGDDPPETPRTTMVRRGARRSATACRTP